MTTMAQHRMSAKNKGDEDVCSDIHYIEKVKYIYVSHTSGFGLLWILISAASNQYQN